ncbi:MAG: hypothetical protein PHQ43_02160 [Dehalococcoidales bacterium]|nr:hypothetical protein [Dehalococcoidales bacterium]
MSMAKRVLIGFLSFLLFLSLSGFGLVFAANRTVLNPGFVVSHLDRLDVTSLSRDLLLEQVPAEIMSIFSPQSIEGLLDDVMTDLEPWIREQSSLAVYSGYDYLLGRSDKLLVVIELETAKAILRDSLWQSFAGSPPLGLDMLSPADLEGLFNEFYDDMSRQMPSTLEINESVINRISPDIVPLLEQARRYIGYLQIAYGVLIGVTAALVAGIILLIRRVKGATLWLGIPCLICGVVAYVSTLLVNRLADLLLAQLILPVQVHNWLPGLLDDSLAPLKMYGIVLMAVGAALLIVSVVYRRRRSSGYYD